MTRWVLLLVGLCALSSAAFGQDAPKTPQRPFMIPLEVRVPNPPTAVKGDGKMHLVYELHVNNVGKDDCTIDEVDVLAGKSQEPIAKFESGKIESSMVQPGAAVTEKRKIGGGRLAIIYLWVTVDSPAQVPARLSHRLKVKVGDYPEDLDLDAGGTPVLTGPIVIDSPLRGNRWVAANGPSNKSGHRVTLIPLDGLYRIPQRFAIDWVQVNDQGETHNGDPLDNKNYLAYGAEAHAVADGVVTEVKDGIPQNIPGANSRAVPITLETVGGNHVIIDIGGGHYAFYAHLQPGSIRVKLGEKVRRGQVVGLVGNSGNSTEPHLHFHIGDANSPLGCEGLPYIIRSFDVEGRGENWKKSPTGGTPEKHVNEQPLENQVIDFPAEKK